MLPPFLLTVDDDSDPLLPLFYQKLQLPRDLGPLFTLENSFRGWIAYQRHQSLQTTSHGFKTSSFH